MINSKINKKIVKLWNSYYSNNPEVNAPLLYDTFAKNSLLFVGMNPSFSSHAFRTIFRGSKYEAIDPNQFFKWSNVSKSPELIDECILMDKLAYANYTQYFGRPIEMAEAVGLPWDHIDLFLYRETSQTSFMKRIHDGRKLNQFALDQLEIFKDALHAVNPKCIVVSNAFGSQIVRDYFADYLTWDDKRGHHWYSGNGSEAPIFFTSMLSGQRSLDR